MNTDRLKQVHILSKRHCITVPNSSQEIQGQVNDAAFSQRNSALPNTVVSDTLHTREWQSLRAGSGEMRVHILSGSMLSLHEP